MTDRDYVLGTQDEEIGRLGLQHEIWRERMFDGWRRAGIGPGQTVIDVGAGPGFASADLAGIVGPDGRVLALERSRRFLDALDARAGALGHGNIEPREQDVAESFGEAIADAAWCRWVLSFVTEPRRSVAHIARALKPGGVAVFHEYGDYGAWRMLPPDAGLDRFRTLVVQSWRDAGGEPDIALHLPQWLADEGMEVTGVRPLIDVVGRGDPAWQWPASFMAGGARRLAELGYLEREEADRLATTLDRAPAETLMMTPLVLEVIARRRAA